MPAGAPLHLARTKKLLKHAVPQEPDPLWLTAVHAAESKQAQDIRVLDLRDLTSFTDTLIICSGANSRQNQAISNEIEQQLKKHGDMPSSVEGYTNAEWILMDYGDYVLNIFSEKARAYYDLERLWRDAKPVKY
ncbi:MAG TPA: ribosome silencing factor [Bryobacteraceae bacterium]|nr:ribosome silencing factor [Bryobacteraceae bacterium]